jgi:hypothetical protein
MSEITTKIFQTTQYRILELNIVFKSGSSFERLDISSVFLEINLFDNLFLPVMSGNIVIRDAQNLFDKIRLNGDEKISIRMDKGQSDKRFLEYRKEFAVYKISNRTSLTPNSQIYTIHFVNEDFLYSLQKKVGQYYKTTYSEMVSSVLKNYLKVEDRNIGNFYESKGVHEIVVPYVNPFKAINFITKRAISEKGNADFLFYESPLGYNFEPLSSIVQKPDAYTVNFKPKNYNDNFYSEFLGAREFEILSSFNIAETIKSGSYGGKFVGFDPFTRTQKTIIVKDAFNQVPVHANKNSNLTPVIYKEGKNDLTTYDMTDSRVEYFPFSLPQLESSYIKENDPATITNIDNTHEYIFQRKSILTNLLQKRMKIVLPGNFGLYAGIMLNVIVPKFSVKDSEPTYENIIDTSLSGRYLVTSTRHILKYNKHETLIEIATDSNM